VYTEPGEIHKTDRDELASQATMRGSRRAQNVAKLA
jgi:hypothetical protein